MSMMLDLIVQAQRACDRLQAVVATGDLHKSIEAAEHFIWCLKQIEAAQDAKYCELCGIAGAAGDPKLCADCSADVYGTTLS